MPIIKFPRGAGGAGIQLDGIVDTYANLPALGPGDAGATYLVDADGLLYVWSGAAWPADGNGVEFRGPPGPPGADGAVVEAVGFDSLTVITQAAYDALDPPDSDTIYFITVA